jgi:adenylate kinase family enzyme
MTFATRVVIIGNSGSGKSTRRAPSGGVAARGFSISTISIGRTATARSGTDAAKQLVVDAAAAPAWIIEGVFGWLAETALPRASALIWLDVPWSTARDGLFARSSRGAPTDHATLLEWA